MCDNPTVRTTHWSLAPPPLWALAVLSIACTETQAASMREGSDAQRLATLPSSPTQARDNEDDQTSASASAPPTTPHQITINDIHYTHSLAPSTSDRRQTDKHLGLPDKLATHQLHYPPKVRNHHSILHVITYPTTVQQRYSPAANTSTRQHVTTHLHRPQTPNANNDCNTGFLLNNQTTTPLPTMPIANLLRLQQTKCMFTGHLTYSSMPPPDIATINTACNTFLKTPNSLRNTSICYILQTSPKISKALVSFHSKPFNTFAISIPPKNTVSLFCTKMEEAVLLPDSFASATDPASQIGFKPLGMMIPSKPCPGLYVSLSSGSPHLTYQMVTPLTAPSQRVSTIQASPHGLLPSTSSPPRNRLAASIPSTASLFDATNWSAPVPGHTLLAQLDHDTVDRCGDTALLMPSTTSTPTVSKSLFNLAPPLQQHMTPHTNSNTNNARDLLVTALQQRQYALTQKTAPCPSAAYAAGASSLYGNTEMMWPPAKLTSSTTNSIAAPTTVLGASKKLVAAYVNANPAFEFSPSSGARPIHIFVPCSIALPAPAYCTRFSLHLACLQAHHLLLARLNKPHPPSTFSRLQQPMLQPSHGPVTLYPGAKPTAPVPPLPTHPKDQLMKPSTTATRTVPYTSTPPHPNIFFSGKICLCHVVPFLHNGPFLSDTNTTAWLSVPICMPHSMLSTTTLTQSQSAEHQLRCLSAALLHCQMNVPHLVQYLGHPHLAAHHDGILAIFHCLHLGCDQLTVRKVCCIYTTSPPPFCKKVLVKDSRHGKIVLVDQCLYLFIPTNLHFTPLGIADKANNWKKSHQIIDASFQIIPNSSSCINNWTNKSNKLLVTFPGSFLRFLIIPIHAYQACGYLGFATGQSFGGCFCPTNWDPRHPRPRIQMARYWVVATDLPQHSMWVVFLCATRQLSPKIAPLTTTWLLQAHLYSTRWMLQ
eukprot:jgi/Psemu1/1987/gm1.1987_g